MSGQVPTTDPADVEVSLQMERAAFDEHYSRFPQVRPERWELAMARAELDGHAACGHPELVRRAVEVLGPNADLDALMAWAVERSAADP